MERVSEKDKEFRGGDWGVKYLFRGPKIDWGIIYLKPGQEMGGHGHREVEETFYVIQGRPKFLVDGKEYQAEGGDVFRIEPFEKHDIVNDGPEPAKVIFIKCPYLPDDKI